MSKYHSAAPHCPRCKCAMRFHTSETVRMADGDRLMDIFQCEECGQLAARAEARSIAA